MITKYRLIAIIALSCLAAGGITLIALRPGETVQPASWWRAHPTEMAQLLESCGDAVPHGAHAENCENAFTARIDNTIAEAHEALRAMDSEGK